jgi:hypothetical protein
MATVATNNIPLQRSVAVTAVAVARGTRLTINSDGLGAASAIGIQGDFIALENIPASGRGLCAPIGAGGSVTVIAGEAGCDRGDVAYSMAAGLTGVTTTNAVIMGKWLQTTANGALGVIELKSVS